MEFDIEDPNAEVDDSICPVCRGSTYVGETIRYFHERILLILLLLNKQVYFYLQFSLHSCETCHYWFHFECVGVTHADECVIKEDVPYYCPTCCRSNKNPVSFKSINQPPKKSSNKNPKKRNSQSSKGKIGASIKVNSLS